MHSPTQLRRHSVGPGQVLRGVYGSDREGCVRSPRFDGFTPFREDDVLNAVGRSLAVVVEQGVKENKFSGGAAGTDAPAQV